MSNLLYEGVTSTEDVDWCDDVSHDRISSSNFDSNAVLKGIVHFVAITPVQIQVDLRFTDLPETFTF